MERMIFLIDPSYSVVIGAGGAGGIKNGDSNTIYGSAGGDTSFGSLIKVSGGGGTTASTRYTGGAFPPEVKDYLSSNVYNCSLGMTGYNGANGGSNGNTDGQNSMSHLCCMFPVPSYSAGAKNGNLGSGAVEGGGGGGGGARGAGGMGCGYSSSYGSADRNGTSAENNTGAGGGGASYYGSYYGSGGNGGSGYCAVMYEIL